MALIDLTDWIGENDFAQDGVVWCVKRLSANDTLATQAHQAGSYMPRDFMFEVFPEIARPQDENPDAEFNLYVDSHADHRKVRAVWYNQKTRNEVRITRFGGSSSALLDPESTGALAIFSFGPAVGGFSQECHVWVCDSAPEEDLALDTVGWVEPGTFRFAGRDGYAESAGINQDCRIAPDEIPSAWIDEFPAAAELMSKAIELRPLDGLDPDERLIRRRDCEFEMFQSVEEALALPVVRRGFTSMDEFIAFAQTTLQRRRVRSGRSLELHTRQILVEEGLVEDQDFTHGGESESGKRPDFLFPSKACYDDPSYPAERLRMLAVKTTCRDRWRQVTDEANRISTKHLLTLQEGVSDGQFKQMKSAGVQLVVPTGLIESYPKSLRPELITVESFIGDLRLLRPPATT